MYWSSAFLFFVSVCVRVENTTTLWLLFSQTPILACFFLFPAADMWVTVSYVKTDLFKRNSRALHHGHERCRYKRTFGKIERGLQPRALHAACFCTLFWGPLGESLRERVSLCISPLLVSVHSILSDSAQAHTVAHRVKRENHKGCAGVPPSATSPSSLIALMLSFTQRAPGHDVLVSASAMMSAREDVLLNLHVRVCRARTAAVLENRFSELETAASGTDARDGWVPSAPPVTHPVRSDVSYAKGRLNKPLELHFLSVKPLLCEVSPTRWAGGWRGVNNCASTLRKPICLVIFLFFCCLFYVCTCSQLICTYIHRVYQCTLTAMLSC